MEGGREEVTGAQPLALAGGGTLGVSVQACKRAAGPGRGRVGDQVGGRYQYIEWQPEGL